MVHIYDEVTFFIQNLHTMQYQFANQKDSYFYDIYQDKDAKKKQTLLYL